MSKLTDEISGLKDANDINFNMLVKVNQKELEELTKKTRTIKKFIHDNITSHEIDLVSMDKTIGPLKNDFQMLKNDLQKKRYFKESV